MITWIWVVVACDASGARPVVAFKESEDAYKFKNDCQKIATQTWDNYADARLLNNFRWKHPLDPDNDGMTHVRYHVVRADLRERYEP